MRFNLAQWSLSHKALIYFFSALLMVSGVFSYLSLGRMEDPDYTIRQMVIYTQWQGATAKQVEEQVTDVLEKRLQDLEKLDHIESYSMPGQSIIYVNLKDSVNKQDIRRLWTDARNLVISETPNLPSGAATPQVNDHFDDVYGMIYALTADDGYTMRDMKNEAEKIKAAVLNLKQTKKVMLIGDRTQCIYADADPYVMMKSDVSVSDIKKLIQSENTVTDSGIISGQKDMIPLRLNNNFKSEKELSLLPINKNGRVIRLSDILNIRNTYVETGEKSFFYNGEPAIGIAVSMVSGENIIDFGDELNKVVKECSASLPAGMELHKVADQAKNVDSAIFSFVRCLVEALIIIFGVSIFSLGTHAGLVVAMCIPLVLAITFSIMYYMGIDLQSVSLGGLIIGLGLLVDDAMIVIEMIIVKLQEGLGKVEAAVVAFSETAIPMLTGTLITCAGFIPVALAEGSASEFCCTLFYVISIALIVSWFVAGLATPLFAYHLISDVSKRKESRLSGFIKRFRAEYRKLLIFCIENRISVLISVSVIFVLCAFGFTQLRTEFFPASSHPELVLRMELPAGASYQNSEEVAARFAKEISNSENLEYYSYTVGEGNPRFVLTFSPANAKPNMAEFIMVAKGIEERASLEKEVKALIRDRFPEVIGHTLLIVTGSPTEYAVTFRVQGPELNKVRTITSDLEKIMYSYDSLLNIRKKGGEEMISLDTKTQNLKLKQLGLTSGSLAQQIKLLTSGEIISSIQDRDVTIPIIFRLKAVNADIYQTISDMPIELPDGKKLSLSSVANLEAGVEEANILRRDRLPAVKICAEIRDGLSGDDVTAQIYSDIKEFRKSLPRGYSIELDGGLEDSQKNTASFLAPAPVMAISILVILMLELQSIKKVMITLLTAPLGIIGVTIGLGITGRPVGFVVILGLLALFGIIIRNSVILMDQIEKHIKEGMSIYDSLISASISRLRPIMLTAMAAILAMIPLATNALWGPMATAMAFGLLFATVLTLLVLPAMYAQVYLKENNR
ncbi:efflux RND transporter permease subunit [Succinivibrio dextrinosolvens]|uniref:efflux RND transporter permease subunit n=1 Tax=Succinivibrio dextrinosolvens TaxID=83771 RepID=UPI001921A19A|nr:efflux RND transporter permease subunit [Succinivibrio dextrinosolvens]